MESNILSNAEILKLVNEFPDHYTQMLRAPKNVIKYGNTFVHINSTYSGDTFPEKLYKHFYGEQTCKKCNARLTSKQFRSFFRGYMGGFCSKQCALHSETRIQHIQQTKLEKYGDSSYNNLSKQQATMLARHGVKHNWSGKSSLREKCYETNLKLHGNRNWNNSDKSTQTKRKNGSYNKQVENLKKTCQDRFGVDFPLLDPKTKEKSSQSIFRKYGALHSTQHPDIVEKCYKNWKVFTFPSGKQIKLQGYEPAALSLLLQTIDENEITTKKKEMPEIWYVLNKKSHRYFPDIYLKSQNKIIEVKSEYTFQSKKEESILKHNECLKKDHLHEIWIFNRKQKLVEIIKDYAS